MKLTTTLLVLFTIITIAFAYLDPTDYDATTLRIFHVRLSLDDPMKFALAQEKWEEWMDNCAVYHVSESGTGAGMSSRFWWMANTEINALPNCGINGLTTILKGGLKLSNYKEQPGQVDLDKCVVDSQLICQAGVDSTGCVQCKNSAVGVSVIAVIAFVACALFF